MKNLILYTTFLLVLAGCFFATPVFGQVVRGQVLDKTTQIPLIGANILVEDVEPLLGTTTDAIGWFSLQRVPLGRHTIQVSYIGYETLRVPEVLVTSGKELVVQIELSEQSFEWGEVVVTPDIEKDKPQNEMAFISARSFSVEETRRYAGGVDDPARMASAFAGVSSGTGVQDNALVIRGNAPKGVLWRLEGVEIPNPNHFAGLSVAGGGGLTLFSSQLLADSDFMTGAFSAEYGNVLAGVFDIRFRNGNPSIREHAFQVGVLGLEAASEGPFTKGKSATYLFNYRYSTLGLLLPLLPTEDLATYQDLSFKLHFPLGATGSLSVWGLGGLDRQTGAASQDSTKWEYETWDRIDSDLHLGIGAAGISHNLILGERALLHTVLAGTINRTDLNEERIGDQLVLEDHLSLFNNQRQLIAGTTLNYKVSRRHLNRTGIRYQHLFYDLDVQHALNRVPPLVELVAREGNSALIRYFSQSKVDLSARWSTNLGLHGQYFDLTEQMVLEPRVGLEWRFKEGQGISAGYGLHSQLEDLRIYFVRPTQEENLPNRDLGLARAHHLVLGYNRTLGPSSRLKVETYYQFLFDVPVIADSSYSMINFEQDFTFNEALVNKGKGRNYGVEMTVERFLTDDYYFLITGSVFSSRYKGGDGIWRSTRFDRGYTLNGLFGKEFRLGEDNLLGINARGVITGGARQSPVDVSTSLSREEVFYDEIQAFSVQDPTLFILDLSLTYRRNHARYSGVWALQIKNVLGAKEIYRDYNFSTRTVERVEEGFPLPVLSYKIEF